MRLFAPSLPISLPLQFFFTSPLYCLRLLPSFPFNYSPFLTSPFCLRYSLPFRFLFLFSHFFSSLSISYPFPARKVVVGQRPAVSIVAMRPGFSGCRRTCCAITHAESVIAKSPDPAPAAITRHTVARPHRNFISFLVAFSV